jgi:biopolymer transport protein exbD/tolR
MIATTFNNYSQFQLSVPKTSTKLEQKENTKIEVIFNKDKKYFLKINDNIQEVSKENISSEFSKLPKEVLKNITLTADEHLEYKDIVDTMSILKNMNIENISLNIQNKN